jgi:hypothetical protein
MLKSEELGVISIVFPVWMFWVWNHASAYALCLEYMQDMTGKGHQKMNVLKKMLFPKGIFYLIMLPYSNTHIQSSYTAPQVTILSKTTYIYTDVITTSVKFLL